MGGYQIIKFIEENLVEVVPSAWLIQEGTQQLCLWPTSVSQNTISVAIKSQQTPKNDWKRFLVQVLSKHPYDSFSMATAKATKATYTSCLETDSEGAQSQDAKLDAKRQRKRNKRIYSSSDNESPLRRSSRFETSPYPTPPKLQKNCNLSQGQVTKVKSNLQDKLSSVIKTASNPTMSPTVSRTESNPTTEKGKCASCIKQEDLFTQVIRLLHIINGRVAQNSELITTLINAKESSASSNVDDNEDVIANNINLPAKSHEDLINLEKQLADEKIKQFLIKKLVHVGGDNIKEVIKRIAPKLVDDEILKQFSWIGGKGKKIFSNLHVSTLIKDVCKKNTNTKARTEKEVEQALAIFLTKATERCNRKMAKENKNLDDPDALEYTQTLT